MIRFFRELKRGSTKTLILSLLEKQPMYGYQMMKEIRKQSNSYFNLSEGSLYPALHDLEKQGFIKSKWRKIKERERKYYYLTNKGLKFFQKTSQEWNKFAHHLSGFLTIEKG